MACLCPRNSISNVVVSLTVHDNIYIYIYTNIFLMDICETYTNMYMYFLFVQVYVYVFRDFGSGLSLDLKDGEPCLRRANAGGGSWRY